MFVQMQIIALGCVRSERRAGWTTVPFLEFDADSYTFLSNLVSVANAKLIITSSGLHPPFWAKTIWNLCGISFAVL